MGGSVDSLGCAIPKKPTEKACEFLLVLCSTEDSHDGREFWQISTKSNSSIPDRIARKRGKLILKGNNLCFDIHLQAEVTSPPGADQKNGANQKVRVEHNQVNTKGGRQPYQHRSAFSAVTGSTYDKTAEVMKYTSETDVGPKVVFTHTKLHISKKRV